MERGARSKRGRRRGVRAGGWLALAALVVGCGAHSELIAPPGADAGGTPVTPGNRVFASGSLAGCSTSQGVPRNCGLRQIGPALACTPGTIVTVGCNASCSLGSCMGDPVLQICPVAGPCDASTALGSDDDAAMCGGNALCSVARFVCPANGAYTVWGGAYSSMINATCDFAVR